MFTQSFDRYVVDGDKITCEVDGFHVVAHVERDDCGDAPDERDEGFWPSQDEDAAGYVLPENFAAEQEKAEQIMTAWKNDEWDYCGVCVQVYREGVALTGEYDHALWGVERNYPGADNSYLAEVANDLLGDGLDAARAKLASLCTSLAKA